MDYENDIRINEAMLDLEWLDQPELFIKYARISAEADKEVDLAKEALDVIDAQIDMDVRSNPSQYKIEKVTEATVTSAILQQKEHREASAYYIEAKFNSKVANGVMKGFDQRKSALENLVKLHGQSYFAGPSIPHDLTSEREKRQRVVDSRIKIRRRRVEE